MTGLEANFLLVLVSAPADQTTRVKLPKTTEVALRSELDTQVQAPDAASEAAFNAAHAAEPNAGV